MTSPPLCTIAGVLLVAVSAPSCCFSPGNFSIDERSVVSTRDVPLGAHGSLRVYGVLSRDHSGAGQSGFGCFGAPYPTCRWETAQPARDSYTGALAVQPAEQMAPPSTASMIMVTSSRTGGGADRALEIAGLDTHDVVACSDDAGSTAVVWGRVAGSYGEGSFIVLGLERGSTLAQRVLDEQIEAVLPPEAASWSPDVRCAWLVAHRDLFPSAG